MKTETADGSYIHNCYIKQRGQAWPGAIKEFPPDLIIDVTDERIFIKLEGYAIVPREEYEQLVRDTGGEGVQHEG